VIITYVLFPEHLCTLFIKPLGRSSLHDPLPLVAE
jgi:hypothetical protein